MSNPRVVPAALSKLLVSSLNDMSQSDIQKALDDAPKSEKSNYYKSIAEHLLSLAPADEKEKINKSLSALTDADKMARYITMVKFWMEKAPRPAPSPTPAPSVNTVATSISSASSSTSVAAESAALPSMYIVSTFLVPNTSFVMENNVDNKEIVEIVPKIINQQEKTITTTPMTEEDAARYKYSSIATAFFETPRAKAAAAKPKKLASESTWEADVLPLLKTRPTHAAADLDAKTLQELRIDARVNRTMKELQKMVTGDQKFKGTRLERYFNARDRINDIEAFKNLQPTCENLFECLCSRVAWLLQLHDRSNPTAIVDATALNAIGRYLMSDDVWTSAVWHRLLIPIDTIETQMALAELDRVAVIQPVGAQQSQFRPS